MANVSVSASLNPTPLGTWQGLRNDARTFGAWVSKNASKVATFVGPYFTRFGDTLKNAGSSGWASARTFCVGHKKEIGLVFLGMVILGTLIAVGKLIAHYYCNRPATPPGGAPRAGARLPERAAGAAPRPGARPAEGAAGAAPRPGARPAEGAAGAAPRPGVRPPEGAAAPADLAAGAP